MPPWLSQVLTRIHAFARAGRVRLTLKAQRELALVGLGLDVQDACDVLVVADTLVYVKLVLRSDCLVVSSHEDEGESHEECA